MSHPRVLPWWPIILPTSTPSLWAKLNNSWTASASVMKLLALHRSYSNRTWMEMLSKKRSALGFCQKMVPCGTPRFPWINILVLLMEIAIWMGTALGPIFRHAHTTIPLLVLHPIYPNKYPHEIPYELVLPRSNARGPSQNTDGTTFFWPLLKFLKPWTSLSPRLSALKSPPGPYVQSDQVI